MSKLTPRCFGYDSRGLDYPYHSEHLIEMMSDNPNFSDDEFAVILNKISQWSLLNEVPIELLRNNVGFEVRIKHLRPDGRRMAQDLFATLAHGVFREYGNNVAFHAAVANPALEVGLAAGRGKH